MSREDCVFPCEYSETVLASSSGRQWDFFGLCGCPEPLVKMTMQLARLSPEQRKSDSMRHVTFDTTAILEIEESLASWRYASPGTAYQDEESMQQDQDSMHCSEAWRYGLLLYVYRIFHWKSGSHAPIPILSYARVVVDHICACRDQAMVSPQALHLCLKKCGPNRRPKALKTSGGAKSWRNIIFPVPTPFCSSGSALAENMESLHTLTCMRPRSPHEQQAPA